MTERHYPAKNELSRLPCHQKGPVRITDKVLILISRLSQKPNPQYAPWACRNFRQQNKIDK